MKSVSQSTLDIQKRYGNIPGISERIMLYEQWQYPISEIIADNQFKLQGDIGGELNLGAETLIIIPRRNFEQYLTIESISYDIGDGLTTITIADTNAVDESWLGFEICNVIDITNRLVIDGIKDMHMKIEGSELSEYDSGKVDIEVDNEDGYFLNSNGDGLFDKGRVMWSAYYSTYRGTEDELLLFGGLLELTDLKPNLYDKTIMCRVYGHTKELERYPAYNVTDDEEDELVQVSGIKIIKYIPSTRSQEGIKSLRYNPFGNTNFIGVTVEGVSDDTIPGLIVLEFRYPNFLKWNNGEWTAITADMMDDSGSIKLFGKGGDEDSNYVVVNVGVGDTLNQLPDSDTEIWIHVLDERTELGRLKVGNQGKPTLQFDNGEKQLLKIHFQRVISNESGEYVEVSDIVNIPWTLDFQSVELLKSNDDYLYLISPFPIYGAFFKNLFSLDTSSIEISYSLGGISFSNPMTENDNGLEDETEGLTKSGRMAWSSIPGFAVNEIVFPIEGVTTDDIVHYRGYMIRIKRVSGTGTLSVNEIKKIVRCKGEYGDFIELRIEQNLLSGNQADDEIIIKRNDEGEFDFSIWYQNISLKYLTEQLLNLSSYTEDKRDVGTMKINLDEKIFNIWGRPPKRNYNFIPKYPTGLYVDGVNEIIYAGIENELWKCEMNGRWEKLVDSEQLFFHPGVKKTKIQYIWKSGDDIFFIQELEPDWWHISEDVSLNLFKYDTATRELENVTAASAGYVLGINGRWCIRHGTAFQHPITGTQYFRGFGQKIFHVISPPSQDYGENLCLPFDQVITCRNVSNHNLVHAAGHIDNTYHTTSFATVLKNIISYEWFFHQIEGSNVQLINTEGRSGKFYHAKMGYYQIGHGIWHPSLPGTLGFRFTYSNKGIFFHDEYDRFYYLNALSTNSNSQAVREMREIKSEGNRFSKYAQVYETQSLSISSIYMPTLSDEDNGCAYFSHTRWYDKGTETKSYSYITKFHNLKSGDWDKVFLYNGSWNDYTSPVNAGTSVPAPGTSTSHAMYFGLDKRFNKLSFRAGYTLARYNYEYWNGSSWQLIENIIPGQAARPTDNLISFDIPNDWEKGTVNSVSDLYWMRVSVHTAFAPPLLLDGRLLEYAIWDSQEEVDGERYMVTWMEYHEVEDTIHGSIFNRETTHTSPFQWAYFVLDLSDNSFHIKRLGDNFFFDGTYTLKDFKYNPIDEKMYFVMEDRRYREKPVVLCTGEYDGIDIVLTSLGSPRESEWGNVVSAIDDVSGDVYGITKADDYIMWQYSDNFYPRVELAKFSNESDFRNVLVYVSEVINYYLYIHSERFLRFIPRDGFNGEVDFRWDKNMLKSKPEFPLWQHYYDAVIVQWENPITEQSGDRKKGFDGWLRKSKSIQNPLIQNSHLADLVSGIFFNYFNQYRINPKRIELIYLHQLEVLDKFTIGMPNKIIDIDKDKEFIITSIKPIPHQKIIVEGIERKVAE
jgi:hypothetical protein